MIAAWMLYSVALGGLLVCATLPVERLLLERGGPARAVWMVALLAGLVLPVAAVLVRDAPPGIEAGNAVVATSATSGAVMQGVQRLALLDGVLLRAWMVVSVALVALLLCALVVIAVRRGRWTAVDLDGVPVLLSEDVGPAVVGFARGRIVVPKWVLGLGAPERAMMLRHEEEHLRAGDPRLLLLGALVVIATPWNPAAWIMLHRLRLAIEIDCDRRVLSSADLDLRRYAELLLAVGARRGVPAYGVGFSVGRPFLEQRIDRMTRPGTERRRAHVLLIALGVFGVLAAAWSVPQPVRAASVSATVLDCSHDASGLTRALLESFDRST
jgi:beta-lactamase regulating signal transducer with metallopeptidase domain